MHLRLLHTMGYYYYREIAYFSPLSEADKTAALLQTGVQFIWSFLPEDHNQGQRIDVTLIGLAVLFDQAS